ncbi:MOSC domain-containing protein [Pseudogracilibacillus sp. SE30717A]|uniref:MOSC domain-containing protein n=1 Tax=Pseudogracilibacillus sp. SE30717A TaxID=3098293 RepID=UPI00300DD291
MQPTQRCVMTTLAQVDLPNDINVLKTLVRENNGNFGVYAEIKRPGHLKVGDEMNIQ